MNENSGETTGMPNELVLAAFLRKMDRNLAEASTLIRRIIAQMRADAVEAAEQLETIAYAEAPFSPLVPGLTVDQLTFLGSRMSIQARAIATSPPLREVANILLLTASQFGMSLEELLGKRRRDAHIRYYAMWLIRHIARGPGENELSYPQIAKIFDLRDHGTVMHGIEVVDRLRHAPDGEELVQIMDSIARRAHSAARQLAADEE